MVIGFDEADLVDFKAIELACNLLGISYQKRLVGSNGKEILSGRHVWFKKQALIVTGKALKRLNVENINSVSEDYGKSNILILGATSISDSTMLANWSDGLIKKCRKFDTQATGAAIRLNKGNGISLEFEDVEYILRGNKSRFVDGFELEDSGRTERLMNVVNVDGKVLCPVFVKCDMRDKSVFFLSSIEDQLGERGEIGALATLDFLQIAPLLMFLKYSFGDQCWHGADDYANLTIDDPWLREPYGHVRFTELCKEARRKPFHATIGFIPYNYDRSEVEAIGVFQECKENLSIAIHGNNHDFREFEKEGNTADDRKRILQAIQRMETFALKTGLSYDRVMIFPRGIFTEASLELLKEQNFLMTVNATSGPVSKMPVKNDVDVFRGVTLRVSNFPMVKRLMVPDWCNNMLEESRSRQWIAMRLFLDLPVLFATHHDYFKNRMNAFNAVAEAVNQAQPAVKWASLGEIARNLYLQRRSSDREVEIQAFSSELVINNGYASEMKYTLCKEEDFDFPIKAVKVDEVEHEYRREGAQLCLEFPIAPGSQRSVQIHYGSKAPLTAVEASRADLQADIIRALSDFRDIHLSQHAYSETAVLTIHRLGGARRVALGFLGLLGFVLLFMACYLGIRKLKKRQG